MGVKSTIRKLQRGFSLVTAIFLLVVLSALGAMMLTFFSAQQQSSALDVMGVRAYQAARAGVEWGAFQVIQSNVAGPVFANGCMPGPSTSSVPALGGTLSVFNVTVSCSAVSSVEGATSIAVYNITSTATFGGAPGQPDYVERVINVTVAQ